MNSSVITSQVHQRSVLVCFLPNLPVFVTSEFCALNYFWYGIFREWLEKFGLMGKCAAIIQNKSRFKVLFCILSGAAHEFAFRITWGIIISSHQSNTLVYPLLVSKPKNGSCILCLDSSYGRTFFLGCKSTSTMGIKASLERKFRTSTKHVCKDLQHNRKLPQHGVNKLISLRSVDLRSRCSWTEGNQAKNPFREHRRWKRHDCIVQFNYRFRDQSLFPEAVPVCRRYTKLWYCIALSPKT